MREGASSLARRKNTAKTRDFSRISLEKFLAHEERSDRACGFFGKPRPHAFSRYREPDHEGLLPALPENPKPFAREPEGGLERMPGDGREDFPHGRVVRRIKELA